MLYNVESSSLPFSSPGHIYGGHTDRPQALPGRNTKRRATGVEYQDRALELIEWISSMGGSRQDELRVVFRIAKNIRICLSVYVRSAEAYSRVFTLLRVASGLPRVQ